MRYGADGERGPYRAAGDIQRIERPLFIKTVNGMAAYDRGVGDLRLRMPAHVHCRPRPDIDLPQPISAGYIHLRANRGSAAKGSADILHLGLTTDTAQGIGVQQIRLAGFASDEDHPVRQQNRSYRSQISIDSIIPRPLRRCKAILQA